MRRLVSVSLCALLFMTIAAAGEAQTTSAPAANAQASEGRPVFVHVNVGFQPTSHDVVAPGAFPLYDEAAIFETRTDTGDGFLFDVGGSVRAWRNVYAGVSYSYVTGSSDGTLGGTVPDVLDTDARRPITGSAGGLGHTEHQVHLQAIWRHPINNKFQVAVAAGPTIFSVSQEVVGGFTINEPTPTVGTVTVTDISGTSMGLNIGAEGLYRLTSEWFAGGFIRYAGGSVDLDTPRGGLEPAGVPSEFSLDVGGLQFGAGVRYRFAGLW